MKTECSPGRKAWVSTVRFNSLEFILIIFYSLQSSREVDFIPIYK